MSIKISGADKLSDALKHAQKMVDVKACISKHGADLNKVMVEKAPVKTGFLRRSIKLSKGDDGMSVTVEPTAEYAPYLEYGTRFMKEHPFVKPALEKVKPKFIRCKENHERLGGNEKRRTARDIC